MLLTPASNFPFIVVVLDPCLEGQLSELLTKPQRPQRSEVLRPLDSLLRRKPIVIVAVIACNNLLGNLMAALLAFFKPFESSALRTLDPATLATLVEKAMDLYSLPLRISLIEGNVCSSLD